jgi:exodeoxyribonuclease VII large subunit
MKEIPASGSGTRAERDIYSVTRLNREVRYLLEKGLPTLWIEAEISNLSRPSSGHWYFSLKDSGAQVRCAMWRQRNMLVKFAPKEGQQVLARARVGLYEPRGDYQLQIEHLEEAGHGALQRQFEELRAKLAAEGLFESARKRPIPRLPRRIGVITSPTGAAVRDILQVLRRRFPAARVLIYPVAVQGADAAPDIVAAIGLASARAECDVLILARGGGSLEDLWAFNEESVARAIAASALPIVAGIGHEVDITIADFVADLRAPTPSAAAELVVPDGAEWLRQVVSLGGRLTRSLRRELSTWTQHLQLLMRRSQLASPAARLVQQGQKLDELELRLRRGQRQLLSAHAAKLIALRGLLWRVSPKAQLAAQTARHAAVEAKLRAAMQLRLRHARDRWLPLASTLHAVSPLATLERGYAIVSTAEGSIVRDAATIAAGADIVARLAHGQIRAKVAGSSP